LDEILIPINENLSHWIAVTFMENVPSDCSRGRQSTACGQECDKNGFTAVFHCAVFSRRHPSVSRAVLRVD
jgi:hypothetical protein